MKIEQYYIEFQFGIRLSQCHQIIKFVYFIYHQLRARRVLMLLKDILVRTRRVLKYCCTMSMAIVPFWLSVDNIPHENYAYIYFHLLPQLFISLVKNALIKLLIYYNYK